MSTQPNIETYRKTFPKDNCNIKYYPELDFLDISEDIKKLSKKKSKDLEEITTPYYSIGFFLKDKLIRIDNVGSGIPKETYVIWENGLIKEAHEFFWVYVGDRKFQEKHKLARVGFILMKTA